jgi:hypothetical protein
MNAIQDALPSNAVANAADALAKLPAWASVTVQIQSNALLATYTMPQPSGMPKLTNHTSTLATHLPATTVLAGEAHDIGTLIQTAIDAAQSANPGASPGASAQPGVSSSTTAMISEIESLVTWIGDGTIAVTSTDDALGVGGGLVLQAADAKTASDKFVQIQNLISLAGSQAGLKTTDETYSGTTITLIDLSGLSGLMGGSTGSGPAAGALEGALANLKIAIAQKDDLVIAGVGDTFVKQVLDAKPGNSLADQDAYKTALDKAGASNSGQFYLDVQGLIGVAKKFVPAATVDEFEKEYAPYIQPIQAYAVAGTTGDIVKVRFVLTVK